MEVDVGKNPATVRLEQGLQLSLWPDWREYANGVIVTSLGQRGVAGVILRQTQVRRLDTAADHQQPVEVQKRVGQQSLVSKVRKLLLPSSFLVALVTFLAQLPRESLQAFQVLVPLRIPRTERVD